MFLDAVAEAEAAREKAWSELERAELEAFKAVRREREWGAGVGGGEVRGGWDLRGFTITKKRPQWLTELLKGDATTAQGRDGGSSCDGQSC